MACCGKFVFVLCFIFAAAATCSFFFPLLRHGKGDDRRTVYQYYAEEKIPMSAVLSLLNQNADAGDGSTNASSSDIHTFVRTNMWNVNCKPARIMFIVSTIAATVGTALSGMTLITLSVLCCNLEFYKVQRVTRVVSIFSPIAFVLLAASVALVAVMFTSDLCSDDTYRFLSFKHSGFNLVEGFGLLCAGAGGMFIVAISQCCI